VTEGDDGPPECRAQDVRVSVQWQHQDDGGLRGRVVVQNTGARACRVSDKPVLRPLDRAGRPLDAHTIVSLEFRHPGFVVVPPGGRAAAAVTWAGWNGPPAGDRALVGWGHPRQEASAAVSGPLQPARTEPPHNLVSGWFELEP
jgi:Protein of unknown function (DUF4232)